MTRQSQALASSTPPKNSSTTRTSINLTSSLKGYDWQMSRDTSQGTSPPYTSNAIDKTSTSHFVPFQSNLDFILYPSSESLSFDTQSISNPSTFHSNKSWPPMDNHSGRRHSERALERYVACEEDFEKVALGLETRRDSRRILEPKLLDILDTL